jgi:CheY-like chemotaxis protein
VLANNDIGMDVNKLNNTNKNPRCLNVLVVENNPDMARVITEILKVKGCNTIVSSNYREAFNIIQTDMPDLVSCDIRLSGKVTGLDFARMIRTDPRFANLLLIAISAFNGEKEKAEAMSAGFDMFFSKPVKFTDLSKAIEICSEQHGVK